MAPLCPNPTILKGLVASLGSIRTILWFGGSPGPKPYIFNVFGGILAPKPYNVKWFGGVPGPKTYNFSRFDGIPGSKPYNFIWIGGTLGPDPTILNGVVAPLSPNFTSFKSWWHPWAQSLQF